MTEPVPPGPDSTTIPAPVPATILCVDDEPNILSALKRLFRGVGLQVRTAVGGAAGLQVLESEPIDLVISDMRMPEMSGTEFLQQVRQRWPDTVRLLLTGYSEVSSIIEAINRGEIYRYISKPWDDNDIVLIVRQALERKAMESETRRLEALTAAQNEELKSLNASLEQRVAQRTAELSTANEKLKANFVTSIKIFSTLIEMRGGALAGHSRRVADLSRKLAQRLKLDSKQVQDLFVAGLLHEIGKVGFSDELLSTPLGEMSPAQQDAYRNHIVQAEQLLMPLPDLKVPTEIIGAQFERYDGTGFPDKLADQHIPLAARILAVASDYDSLQIGTMTRKKLTPDDAKVIIGHGAGKRYDPAVVKELMTLLNGDAPETPAKNSRREVALTSDAMQAGMVLSRDLITPNGLLMLSTNHVLDDRLIQKIKDFERSGGLELTAYFFLN